MIRIRQKTFEAGVWYFQLIGEATDGTIRLAAVESEIAPAVWLAANQAEAQTLIDNGTPASLKDEAKWFLIRNPAARSIIDLSGPQLEAAIENRTANQETLLLKTLAYAVRFLFESIREGE